MTELAQEIFSRLHITTLVHGNMEKEVRDRLYEVLSLNRKLTVVQSFVQSAVELQKVIEDVLSPKTLTEAERVADVSLFLPEGKFARSRRRLQWSPI